jgi:hypothetical protein
MNIPFTQHTLENGLRVIIHEDRRLPMVAVISGITSARKTNIRAAPASRICSNTSCSKAPSTTTRAISIRCRKRALR